MLLSLLLTVPGCSAFRPAGILAMSGARATGDLLFEDLERAEDAQGAQGDFWELDTGEVRLLPAAATQTILSGGQEADPVDEVIEDARLMKEALLALHLMEQGAVEDAEDRIDRLATTFPHKKSAVFTQMLLGQWLARASSRERSSAVDDSAEEETDWDAQPDELGLDESFRTETFAASTQELELASHRDADARRSATSVAFLKQEGLTFYCKGALVEAVSCWRQLLELDPDDAETHQFLRRAETILKHRRAGA